MRHNYIRDDASGDHWAVGASAHFQNVLVQLQSEGEQVRLAIPEDEAVAMAEAILRTVAKQRAERGVVAIP